MHYPTVVTTPSNYLRRIELLVGRLSSSVRGLLLARRKRSRRGSTLKKKKKERKNEKEKKIGRRRGTVSFFLAFFFFHWWDRRWCSCAVLQGPAHVHRPGGAMEINNFQGIKDPVSVTWPPLWVPVIGVSRTSASNVFSGSFFVYDLSVSSKRYTSR